jgi:hypothetical protein
LVEAQTSTTEPEFAKDLCAKLNGAARLPALAASYSSDWTAQSRPVLPCVDPVTRTERTWAPILAWIVLRSLPAHCSPNGNRVELFDRLLLRTALAEIFSSMGMEGEARWQAAAQVRLLLGTTAVAPDAIYAEALWADPDVRWLAGVNVAAGITFFNKQQFEELLTWLQLPALVGIAQEEPARSAAIAEIEGSVAAARTSSQTAGFNLKKYLATSAPIAKATHVVL